MTANKDNNATNVRSVIVERKIQPLIDLKNMTIMDYVNPNSSRNGDLRSAARDAVQLLFNSLFSLRLQNNNSTHDDEDGVLVPLPSNQIIPVPNDRPLAQEKKLTKWEAFALKKGIKKKKKMRYTYSEQFGEDRPTFGYGSAKNDSMNTWLVEVPQNKDPMLDYIGLEKAKSKTTADKNKKQQKKNEMGGKNLFHMDKKEKLESQLRISKSATASLGKFDPTLANDVNVSKGKRRASSLLTSNEGERTMKLAQKVMNGTSSSSSGKKKSAPVEFNKKKAVSMASYKRSRK